MWRAAGSSQNNDLKQILVKSNVPWFVSANDMTPLREEDDDMFMDPEEPALPHMAPGCQAVEEEGGLLTINHVASIKSPGYGSEVRVNEINCRIPGNISLTSQLLFLTQQCTRPLALMRIH